MLPSATPARLPRRAAIGAMLALGACGPTRLAPLPGPPRGRVVLLRGLANVFSTGLNVLTIRLRQAGYDASVHNHVEWRRLATETAEASRQGRLPRPFCAIGHSYGADDAILMAERLGLAGIPTDLVVTFDPTVVRVVAKGPLRVLNFHQDGDPFQRVLSPAPGFDGVIENREIAGETHLSIDKNENLHLQVLLAIETLSAPTPAPALPVARPPAPEARLPSPPRPPVTARR